MCRIYIIIILLSSVSLNNVYACTVIQQDTLIAKNYYNRADSLYKVAQFDSAISYYEKSSNIYFENNLTSKYFKSKIKVASTLRKQRKLDAAINYSKRVVEQIKDKIGLNTLLESSALEVIGNCYNIKSEFDLALEYQLRIVEIRENLKKIPRFYLADAYSNLAITYFRKGHIELSLKNFKATLEIRKQEYGTAHLLVADAYHNLGFLYYIIGQRDLALEYYMVALNIYKKLYGDDHYELGNVYNGIGQVLASKAQYEEALLYYDKAYQVGEEAFGKNHYIVVDAYTNMANANFKKRNYKKALSFNQKTLLANQHQYGENNIATAYSYLQIGECYQELNNKVLALTNLSKSKSILEKIFKDKNPELSNIHNAIGLFYLSLNNTDSALVHFQEAIIFNVIGFDNSNVSINPNLENYLDKNLLLQSLYNKGHCLLKKYKVDPNIKYLKSALKTFRLCDDLNDQIRSNRLLNSDKLALGNISSKIFEEAIEVSKHLYTLLDDEIFLNYMFYFSEKNKGNVLLESINNLNIKNYALVPDSIIIQIRNLQYDIAFWQSRLLTIKNTEKVNSASDITSLETKLFNLKRNKESLTKNIETKYPAYYNLKYKTEQASVKEIQSLLDNNNSTLLEYFVGDSTIYTFTLTKDSLFVHQQPKPNDFDSLALSFQKTITEKDFNTYAKTAITLYKILVDPIKNNLEGDRLIIVPDGVLWYVNFDLLLTSNKSTENYKELDYLLKDYAISYAYSANLLFQESSKPKELITKQPLLAFSFSNSDNEESAKIALRMLRNATTKDLPGSRAEVRAIADIFEGQYYYGKLANEANFKANAKSYSILHLALHGEIDNTYPNNSKLYFTQNSDTIEDGYLYAYELYNMTLNANLAVLSACNTGAGKLVKGEGIMSLGRAFTYAGCKSLVLTQWEVSDATTPHIMKYFYQGLKDGLRKDEALRQAKLKYLATADNLSASPFYWGAFVLLGDNSAIGIDEDNNKVIYGAVILLLVILTFLFFRSKGLKNSG